MGVADEDTAAQTPRVSRIRRLPSDIAVVRSSKLGCACVPSGTASTSATFKPSGANATARLAPTMPPPTMVMSKSSVIAALASCGLHQGFDRVGRFLEGGRQHLRRIGGYQYFIFDAN